MTADEAGDGRFIGRGQVKHGGRMLERWEHCRSNIDVRVSSEGHTQSQRQSYHYYECTNVVEVAREQPANPIRATISSSSREEDDLRRRG